MKSFSKKLIVSLTALILIQTILWIADGRKRLYRQISDDVRFSHQCELEKMRRLYNDPYTNQWTGVLNPSTAERLGPSGVRELERVLKGFNGSLVIREQLPKGPMPAGETAILYEPLWDTPLFAKTELVFYMGPTGASFWENHHLYFMGFWVRIKGRCCGVS